AACHRPARRRQPDAARPAIHGPADQSRDRRHSRHLGGGRQHAPPAGAPAAPGRADQAGHFMRFRYRPDRDLAQRLSDLVDSLVVRRRSDTRGASPAAADRELDDLAALAEELSGISIEPHAMFSDRLHGDIVEGRLSQALSPAAPGWTITRVLTRALHPAAAALLLVAGFVAYSFVGPTPASAREILTRSDQAIAKLVKPGEVLFRRWRISEWIQDT